MISPILKPYGFGYHVVGNTIVVNKLEKIMQVATVAQVESKVFSLKYLDAADVKEVIKAQLSPRGSMSILTGQGQKGWEFESTSGGRYYSGGSVSGLGKRQRVEGAEEDIRSKVIVVSDIPSVLQRVEAIIAEVDQRPQQVLIEAKFLEVSSDALQDIGVEFGVEGLLKDSADRLRHRPRTGQWRALPGLVRGPQYLAFGHGPIQCRALARVPASHRRAVRYFAARAGGGRHRECPLRAPDYDAEQPGRHDHCRHEAPDYPVGGFGR